MLLRILKQSQEGTPGGHIAGWPWKGLTVAAAERRLWSAILEATQDLLFADIAVADQQELEQVIVLFLLTRHRRAGLTCSHNIRLSQTRSILQVTRWAMLALSRFRPYSRSVVESATTTLATTTSDDTFRCLIASYHSVRDARPTASLMDLDRRLRSLASSPR